MIDSAYSRYTYTCKHRDRGVAQLFGPSHDLISRPDLQRIRPFSPSAPLKPPRASEATGLLLVRCRTPWSPHPRPATKVLVYLGSPLRNSLFFLPFCMERAVRRRVRGDWLSHNPGRQEEVIVIRENPSNTYIVGLAGSTQLAVPGFILLSALCFLDGPPN